MTRRARYFSLGAVLLLAAVAAAIAAAHHLATRPGPLETATRIVVERGDGLSAIAERLVAAGAIERPLLFRATARFLRADRALRAGEFEIPARASLVEIIETLRSGELVRRRLTVPEGLSSLQIVGLLRRREGLQGSIETVPAEGSLLPQTYFYHYGDRRSALLNRMAAAQAETLDELWPQRARDLPYRSSFEAVTLASILEKETGLAKERRLVASVFVNRLERGMRLQSDPTVIYGLTGGMPLGRPLTREDLESDTPYNTYTRRGLPPTPIANPGRAAIAAALDPADTDYLFFVAKPGGGHAFAKTLQEHNQNVAEWRNRNDGDSN